MPRGGGELQRDVELWGRGRPWGSRNLSVQCWRTGCGHRMRVVASRRGGGGGG